MSKSVFLYGTLLDSHQLAAVLGHSSAVLKPDALPGHVVRPDRRTGSFPVLLEEAEGTAPGAVFVAGASDILRLDWYEAIHGYERRAVTLASGVVADAYFTDAVETLSESWSLEDWRSEWGEIVEAAAREAISAFPDTPPGDVGRRYHMILSRAASAGRARATDAPAAVRKGAGRKGLSLVRSVSRHRGFFALDEMHLDHRRFDGGRESIVREVFVATDAALLLPYDPSSDRVVLIEQMRSGPYRRGDRNPWCLEPIAGLVDAGETPEACAKREAMEEAGIEISEAVPVPGGYPSPGVTTEYYHLFVGLADLSDYRPQAGGVAQEGEDILSHPMNLDTAMSLLDTGEANVLPLAYLLTWTAANRDRLQSGARH